ncbi:MAG: serine protease [Verrucomicrobia bacterium]|nr:serine protease [Verrucomicrobiota bacterium]
MILRLGWLGLILASLPLGASETPDLRALAKQARPAVYLLALQDEDGEVKGSGTGFLVSPDGLLVTNHHVVTGAKHILAKAENGGLFPVTRIIASDPANDLALLQVEGKDLSSAVRSAWRAPSPRESSPPEENFPGKHARSFRSAPPSPRDPAVPPCSMPRGGSWAWHPSSLPRARASTSPPLPKNCTPCSAVPTAPDPPLPP